MTPTLYWPLVLLAIALAPLAAPAADVGAPPDELRERLKLSPFYAKHLDCDGLPILASAEVSDFSLREAAFLVRQLLLGRDDVRSAIIAAGIRLAVMSTREFTTDIPEHHDLAPASYWNRRARGLGATVDRPTVSCAEENLLCLAGDPYAEENILIHEFAHVIHEFGLAATDTGFDARLQEAFAAARMAGRWTGHYALTNHREYWAEGTQAWFSCIRPTASVHDRESLRSYDPPLAALLAEVFRDNPWTYVRPDRRVPPSAHLAGLDRVHAPVFTWPEGLRDAAKP